MLFTICYHRESDEKLSKPEDKNYQKDSAYRDGVDFFNHRLGGDRVFGLSLSGLIMRETYTEEQIKVLEKSIDTMSHREMAVLWRFSPSGHPLFDIRLPLFEKFKKRFEELGGMTPEISKSIGW